MVSRVSFLFVSGDDGVYERPTFKFIMLHIVGGQTCHNDNSSNHRFVLLRIKKVDYLVGGTVTQLPCTLCNIASVLAASPKLGDATTSTPND